MEITSFLPGALADAVYAQHTDCVKLAPGPFMLRLDRFEGRNLVIDLGYSTNQLSYSGFSYPDKARMGFPLCLPGEARFRGGVIVAGTLEYLCPGGEVDGYYPGGSTWTSISTKGSSIHEVLRRYAGDAALSAVEQAAYLSLPIAEPIQQRLRPLITLACRQPIAGDRRDALEQELTDLLFTAFADGLALPREFAGHANRRYQVMQRAREIALQYVHDPISLTTLAEQIGTSVRTLEYAFNSVYQISAGSYLRMLRLNRAYRQLLEADRYETTVTRVATHWGFWHMGEFGVAYKRLFGERPSDTLKRIAPIHRMINLPIAHSAVAHARVA